MGTSFILFSNPALQLIRTGKGEAIRIRSILRSLVPTEDLVGIISIPLKLPSLNKGKRSSQGLSPAGLPWGPLSRGQNSVHPPELLPGCYLQGSFSGFISSSLQPAALSSAPQCQRLLYPMSRRHRHSRPHSPPKNLSLWKEANGAGPVKSLMMAFLSLCPRVPQIMQPAGATDG